MNTQVSYKTLENNAIHYMLKHVEEYEQVKAKEHPDYKHARAFFAAKGICYQNFYKFYRRYRELGRDPLALLPIRRGPKSKYQTMPDLEGDSVEAKALKYREAGHNRFTVAAAMRKDERVKGPCSSSTIYRIWKRYGVSRLTKPMQEEKRKLMREKAGSLIHVDCHQLPRGLVKEDPLKRYYVLGVIDNFSRIAWTEVMSSVQAIDATFAMMDAILVLHQEYGITCEEVLTDNGSEFCGGEKSKERHPFERLLLHFGIKHLRTRPYRPQTNGKIERYWKTFDEMVIEGTEFETLEQLKDAVLGYNFYYNEQRPHQGIDGKTPLAMLPKKE